jgi:hypothetical protein
MKFYENPPSGSQFFHADRRKDGQTDKTKQIVAFRNFAKAPKHQHNPIVIPRMSFKHM